MTVPPHRYEDRVAGVYAAHRGTQPHLLRALIRRGRVAAGARVLEVGCGTANYLRAIQALTGAAGWGLDPAPAMLAQARAAAAPPDRQRAPLCLQVGRAEALPFAGGCFDLLYTVDVVHHIAHRDVAFAEAARVLRSGGRLITATDSAATIRARVPLSSHFPDTVAHELARYPSEAELTSLHRDHGLQLLDAFVVADSYVLRDATPFRRRAYSCLHLISDAALAAGVRRLEQELPLSCASRNYVFVAQKP